MTNDEIRMTKHSLLVSSLVIFHSFVIRSSSLVILYWLPVRMR